MVRKGLLSPPPAGTKGDGAGPPSEESVLQLDVQWRELQIKAWLAGAVVWAYKVRDNPSLGRCMHDMRRCVRECARRRMVPSRQNL